MQDTTSFETILGISVPWHVARVELKTLGEVRGAVAGARRDPMAVPGVRRRSGRLRPRRGTDLAPSGTPASSRRICVPEIPRVQCPTHGVEASASALGRTAQSLHAVDGAIYSSILIRQRQTVRARAEICGGQLGDEAGRDEPAVARGERARGAAHPLHWRR